MTEDWSAVADFCARPAANYSTFASLKEKKVEHSHICLIYLSQDGRFSYGILILKSEHCSLINLATARTKVMYKLHMLNLLSVSPIIPSGQKNKRYINYQTKIEATPEMSTG